MILVDDTYLVQGKPKMMADGYRLIGHEDIHATGDLEDAIYYNRKAEEDGNYQDIRIVKHVQYEIQELTDEA